MKEVQVGIGTEFSLASQSYIFKKRFLSVGFETSHSYAQVRPKVVYDL